MNDDERRTGTRFLAEFSVALRPAQGGALIDGRATAHDLSVKGFKVETQAQLPENTLVSFSLELSGGASVAGKGRIVWSKRETLATWAGLEIVSISWGDKWRLNRLLHPNTLDWARLSHLFATLVMALTVLAAARRVLYSAPLRGLLILLAPKIIALLIMGWALAGLLKRKRR